MPSRGKILIGISGGIAAYKSLSLIRLFVKAGYEVRVIATKNALEFVTPLSIETLSKNKLYCDVFASPNEYSTEHISITDSSDVFIIAPASANVIGKFASGIADDALSTSFLAFNKPIFIAPAMNCKMYENFAVQKNIQYLKDNGINFIEPTLGDLACGYKGKGRMQEPDEIFSLVDSFINKSSNLVNKKILVTTGPTYEAIDPVRFIGNYSSGKMGVSIANELSKRGADVTLVCGPITQKTNTQINRLDVISANEMFDTCIKESSRADIIIMAAAVADYTPKNYSDLKIKKNDTLFDLKLKKTKDILKELGRKKTKNQILIGFALETNNEILHAKEKLKNKNLDFIVLNSLNDDGAGFGVNTNKISIIDSNENISNFELKTKEKVASDIIDYLENKLNS